MFFEKFISSCSPRLSSHSDNILPKYNSGTIIVALIHGSSILEIFITSGISAGLCKVICSPFVKVMLYTTLGDVVIISRLNSRSKRSCIISKCNNPKNPHLKPNPRAADVSVSKLKLESFK